MSKRDPYAYCEPTVGDWYDMLESRGQRKKTNLELATEKMSKANETLDSRMFSKATRKEQRRLEGLSQTVPLCAWGFRDGDEK